MRWLADNAGVLFAAIRRVVADSLRAYDLGFELSARIAHRWDTFGADRHTTRMAWALVLAAMERSAPSPGELSRLRPSDLVRRSSSDVRQDP